MPVTSVPGGSARPSSSRHQNRHASASHSAKHHAASDSTTTSFRQPMTVQAIATSDPTFATPARGRQGVDRDDAEAGGHSVDHRHETSVIAPIAPPNAESLNLWGLWEMWVDVPFHRSGGHGVAASGATTVGGEGAKSPAPALATTSSASPSASPGATNNEVNTWLDAVKSLGMFETAQGFWCIMNCIVPPSKLPNGGNFYMFRYKIPPMWEHEANRRGGKWMAQYTVEEADACDRAWVDLCVACIGEQLPGDEEEICGAAVSKRRSGYKLSLWTRNANEKDSQTKIGFFLKVLFGLKARGTLKYMSHCTSYTAPPTTAPRSPLMPTAGSMPPPPASNSGPKSPLQGNSPGNSPVVAAVDFGCLRQQRSPSPEDYRNSPDMVSPLRNAPPPPERVTSSPPQLEVDALNQAAATAAASQGPVGTASRGRGNSPWAPPESTFLYVM